MSVETEGPGSEEEIHCLSDDPNTAGWPLAL